MATKEFIQKRIEGKQREIAKLTAKLERISKAEATGWEVNPYGYYEHDKKYTLKDLEEAQASLAKYQAQLSQAEEKELSRNVPAIPLFLNTWMVRMREFYMHGLREFYEDKEKLTQLAMALHNTEYGTEAYNQAEEIYKAAHKTFWENSHGVFKKVTGVNRWGKTVQVDEKVRDGKYEYLQPYNQESSLDEASARLERDLQAEWERKYDFIIERTNEIVGQITDASHLEVGAKGDLNGYIIGTRGTAKVQTIGAGGYNIQCFHFRTLINPMTTPKSTPKSTPKATSEKHEKPQEAKKVPDTQSYKGKTIDELKTILASLGGECKVYNDEKIYKMRLIMAIKKVG